MATMEPRTRAIRWAQRMIRNPETVFIDTETTGLDGAAEIVDIALVDVDGQVLMDTLVQPKRRIPAGASRIHGILDQHVADAPMWTDIYTQLLPLLGERPVVIFNVEFDRKIMHQCCQQHGLELFPGAQKWHCAMLEHATYVGEPGRWGKGFRWHSLDKAAAGFGIPPGGHRARADAEACRQVVHHMAEA